MSSANPHPDQFNAIVWTIARQIPRGRVATYGMIASMIPAPPGIAAEDYERLGPRWVGEAMNAVSSADDPTIPWHRVINARGGISLPPESRAGREQRQRLEAEGVEFGPRNTCDLNRYGWDGPEPDFLRRHGLQPPRSLKQKPARDGGQLSLF